MFSGGIYVYTNMDSLAQRVAEKVASEALGVKVTIGSMEIKLAEKMVRVSALNIANPAGFKKPYAIKIKNINIGLDALSKDLINFKSFNIDEAKVFLEVTEKGTNLQALTAGMKAKAPARAEDAPPPMKVIVQNFTMTQAQLKPSAVLFAEDSLSPILIPDIELTGIGQRQNGILAREAIAQVINHVVKIANKSGAQAGFFEGLSADKLKEIGISRFQMETGKLKSKIQDSIGSIFGDE